MTDVKTDAPKKRGAKKGNNMDHMKKVREIIISLCVQHMPYQGDQIEEIKKDSMFNFTLEICKAVSKPEYAPSADKMALMIAMSRVDSM